MDFASAEGVETAAQVEALGRHGFFFSRPLPAEECTVLLQELTHTAFSEIR